MTALVLAVAAGCGTYLLVAPRPSRPRPPGRLRPIRRVLPPNRDLGGAATFFALGLAVGYILFGGIGPPFALGLFAASAPIGARRNRDRRRLERARDAWPRLIEEIRLQTGVLGRSIPQAVFEAGRSAPEELRPAFRLAHREWLLTTDLARALAVLTADLVDPTADMVSETLLVAHELGATDLDGRLETLAVDRFEDLQRRKDARARQEAARFARRFVIAVPAGMAVAGMSIGDGRQAFGSAAGQAVVLVAIGLTVGCWVWAGRVMRLPEPERVFAR